MVTQELLVGDIVLLDSGDRMLVDGVLIDSMGLVLDEAALTGTGNASSQAAYSLTGL